MLRKILIALSFIFIASLSFATLPTNFSNYYIFGDSLSDAGNYQTVENTCVLFSAPVTNHSAGTDGEHYNTVWANSGFGPFNTTNIKPSNEGGTDYAVNRAKTAEILGQVDSYLSHVHNVADPNAIYIIWAGANDLIAQDSPGPAMANIFRMIYRLKTAGAKNFLIIGLPDVSVTPMAANSNTDVDLLIGVANDSETVQLLHDGCQTWNTDLTNLLKNIQWPGVNIYYFDTFNLLDQLVQHPSGPVDPNDPPYSYPSSMNFATSGGITDASYPNNWTTICGNTSGSADPNPDHYIFYNYIHPSAYTHYILAQYLIKHSELVQRTTAN